MRPADTIRPAISVPPEEKHSRTCGLLGHDLCRPCAALHALALMEAELKALREALWNAVPTLVAHAPDDVLNQAQSALKAP